MKQTLLVGFILALFSTQVNADLNKLIYLNIMDISDSNEMVNSPAEHPTKPPRLWIHVQTEDQIDMGEEIYNKVLDISVGNLIIERKPVLTVGDGPLDSQLRYFKKEDKTQAQELFETLRGLIPGLKLKDFSQEYSHVGWIKSGHYELWLSPELMHLIE